MPLTEAMPIKADAYKTDASEMEAHCVDFDNKYNVVKKLGFRSSKNRAKQTHVRLIGCCCQ